MTADFRDDLPASPAGEAGDIDDAWQRHRAEQVARWASRSPAERLAWLWQAKEFAAQALGSARSAPTEPAEEELVLEKGAIESP